MKKTPHKYDIKQDQRKDTEKLAEIVGVGKQINHPTIANEVEEHAG